MLQIITGKFFKSEDRHISEQKAVLYSNYRWYLPIETCIGRLEPLDVRSELVSYLFSYKNQIEKRPSKFEIVRVGDGQIIEQFRLLCAFGLRGTFAEDRNWVSHLCRSRPIGQSDKYTPSELLSGYFSTRIDGNLEETKEFAILIAKILSLRRDDYLSIIKAIRALMVP